jgi:small conductance mechanosensitive channel
MLEEKTQELMVNMQAVLPLIVTNALSALGAIVILLIGLWLSGKADQLVVRVLSRTPHFDPTLKSFFGSLARYLILTVTLLAVLSFASMRLPSCSVRAARLFRTPDKRVRRTERLLLNSQCAFVEQPGAKQVSITVCLPITWPVPLWDRPPLWGLAYSTAPTRLVAFLWPSREISGRWVRLSAGLTITDCSICLFAS